MRPRVSVHDAAMRLEGPLLFMRRTLEVGLNEAVIVTGPSCQLVLPPATVGRVGSVRSIRTVACTQAELKAGDAPSKVWNHTSVWPSLDTVRL